MSKVLISGVAMTAFGKFLDRSVRSLAQEAADAALERGGPRVCPPGLDAFNYASGYVEDDPLPLTLAMIDELIAGLAVGEEAVLERLSWMRCSTRSSPRMPMTTATTNPAHVTTGLSYSSSRRRAARSRFLRAIASSAADATAISILFDAHWRAPGLAPPSVLSPAMLLTAGTFWTGRLEGIRSG